MSSQMDQAIAELNAAEFWNNHIQLRKGDAVKMGGIPVTVTADVVVFCGHNKNLIERPGAMSEPRNFTPTQ